MFSPLAESMPHFRSKSKHLEKRKRAERRGYLWRSPSSDSTESPHEVAHTDLSVEAVDTEEVVGTRPVGRQI